MDLQYFKGKVCTVFIDPEANFRVTEKTFPYLVGYVDSIDEKGIQLTQLGGTQKCFWFHPHIRGIAEEKVLDPEKDAVEIEQLKQHIDTPKSESPFVDTNQLNQLNELIKRANHKP